MAVSNETQAEYWDLYENFSSIYYECARECKHAILQELMATGRYLEEEEAKRRVTSRVKPPDRTFGKAEIKSSEEITSIDDLQQLLVDIVGAKAVLDDLKEAENMVGALLDSDRWEVQSHSPIANPDGYHAVSHIDVVMVQRDDRMRAELQVRTRLQEAWSIWAHPVYEVERNPETDNPPPEILEILGKLGMILQEADEAADQVTRVFQQWVEASK